MSGLRSIVLCAAAIACPTGLAEAPHAAALAQRLSALIAEVESQRPDRVQRPGLGERRYRYEQALRVDPDRPCQLRYRYLLSARVLGGSRRSDRVCSHLEDPDRCTQVTIDLRTPPSMVVVDGEGAAHGPHAIWYRLGGGATHAPMAYALMSPDRAHHLLVAEALAGLVAACAAQGTGTEAAVTPSADAGGRPAVPDARPPAP